MRLGTRNRLRTYLTNMPPVALAVTLPGHLLATLYLYLRAIGKPHATALRKGVTQALGMLPDVLKRRRVVQKSRQVSSLTLFRAMSWNPVKLHGRRTHIWAGVARRIREGRENQFPRPASQ